jgi:hypothetical protein
MVLFQTLDVPPTCGSNIFPAIGWMEKIRTAPRNAADAKSKYMDRSKENQVGKENRAYDRHGPN